MTLTIDTETYRRIVTALRIVEADCIALGESPADWRRARMLVQMAMRMASHAERAALVKGALRPALLRAQAE